uniref:Uncharacterized protein n=1 Tax=Salmo trutta TaxID=8032 RepID=A0A673YFU2_SALTR
LLCLMELNNNSPVEEIQSRTERKLTPGQYTEVGYLSQVFRIMSIHTAPSIPYSLTPDLSVVRSLPVSLALAASQLEELHLSCNTLGDMGLKRLFAGLEDPHCQIQKLGFILYSVFFVLIWDQNLISNFLSLTPFSNSLPRSSLRLRQCNLSEISCESLDSVLCSNSTLRELDLRDNDLGDSGVERLSAALRGPSLVFHSIQCQLLSAVLRSNPSHLRELDLRTCPAPTCYCAFESPSVTTSATPRMCSVPRACLEAVYTGRLRGPAPFLLG